MCDPREFKDCDFYAAIPFCGLRVRAMVWENYPTPGNGVCVYTVVVTGAEVVDQKEFTEFLDNTFSSEIADQVQFGKHERLAEFAYDEEMDEKAKDAEEATGRG